MKIFLIIELTIFITAIILLLIQLLKITKNYKEIDKRNDEVSKFLRHINQVLCHEYCERRLKAKDTNWDWPQKWFLGKYKYTDFVFSNKPLTLEEWWTKEEINKLLS